MDEDILDKEGVRKAPRRPSEALSWVREGLPSLKRTEALKSWPFPTYKGQPLEPLKYPRQPRVNPDGPDALM